MTANFSWERFDERYISDLADGLGNLATRSLAMIEKYRGGIVPAGASTSLDGVGAEQVRTYRAAMDSLDLRGGADAAWSLVTAANQFIVQTAPWTLAKQGKDSRTRRGPERTGPLPGPLGGIDPPHHAREDGNSLGSPRAGCQPFGRLAASGESQMRRAGRSGSPTGSSRNPHPQVIDSKELIRRYPGLDTPGIRGHLIPPYQTPKLSADTSGTGFSGSPGSLQL